MKKGMSGEWPRVGAMAHELGVTPEASARAVSLLRDFDLNAIQLGMPLLGEILTQEDLVETWRSHLQAAGMSIVALGGYCNLAEPDEPTRRRNIAFLQRCLEIAPQFGTTVVATETGTFNRENKWDRAPENQGQRAWDTVCATVSELLPVAARHGSILALEGHVNHVINTPERLASLLEQFSSPHLRVVLDPYNYLSSDLLPRKDEAIRAFLDQFRDDFAVAHLKDVSDVGAEVDTPGFGQGVFPQHIYLDFLKSERPDLPLVLEHVAVERILATLQKLHQVLGVTSFRQ